MLGRIIPRGNIHHDKALDQTGVTASEAHGHLSPQAVPAKRHRRQTHPFKPQAQVLDHGANGGIFLMEGIAVVAQVE